MGLVTFMFCKPSFFVGFKHKKRPMANTTIQIQENQLESIIFNAPLLELSLRGLEFINDVNGKFKKQVKIGNYGITDLIYFERPIVIPNSRDIINGSLYIIELKKDKLTFFTFHQILRYYQGISDYLLKYHSKLYFNIEINIVMIGKNINMNDSFIYLPNLFNNIQIYTYDYNFDGIQFKLENDYHLANTGLYKIGKK